MVSTITSVKIELTYGDINDTKTICHRINISELKMGENKIIITSRRMIRLLRCSSLYEIFNLSLVIIYGDISRVVYTITDFPQPPATLCHDCYDSDSSDSSDDSSSCCSDSSDDSCSCCSDCSDDSCSCCSDSSVHSCSCCSYSSDDF